MHALIVVGFMLAVFTIGAVIERLGIVSDDDARELVKRPHRAVEAIRHAAEESSSK